MATLIFQGLSAGLVMLTLWVCAVALSVAFGVGAIIVNGGIE